MIQDQRVQTQSLSKISPFILYNGQGFLFFSLVNIIEQDCDSLYNFQYTQASNSDLATDI